MYRARQGVGLGALAEQIAAPHGQQLGVGLAAVGIQIGVGGIEHHLVGHRMADRHVVLVAAVGFPHGLQTAVDDTSAQARLVQHVIASQVGVVIAAAVANGQARRLAEEGRACRALEPVMCQGHAPGRGGVLDHGRVSIAATAAVFTGAVRRGQGIAPGRVDRTHVPITKLAPVGHGVVQALVGDVGVERTQTVHGGPHQVGAHHGVQPHGVLAAQRQRAPVARQANVRLATKAAAALLQCAGVQRHPHLQHKLRLQPIAQVFRAAKSQPRGHDAGGDRRHPHQRTTAADPVEVFHPRIDHAIDLHIALGTCCPGRQQRHAGNGHAALADCFWAY